MKMLLSDNVFQDLRVRHQREDAGTVHKFKMHTHTNAELFYFICGKAVYHIEGTVYALQPGDILLMRPGEVHHIEQDPAYPYERLVINFAPELLERMEPDNRLMRAYTQRKAGKRNLYRTADLPEDVCRFYLEGIRDAGKDRLTALANLILLLDRIGQLFDSGLPADTPPETLEYRIIRYINKNFSREVSIQELCEKFFISRAQLCRRFKKATGTTVGKYVAAKRLIAAQSMILQGTKPVDAYCLCGYQDYSTFYRAYLQYFGHSPSQAHRTESTEDDRLELV